jgi:hypothetical protein
LVINHATVFPDVPPQANGGGGFPPHSFDHLLHLQVQLPSLDPTWEHTLVEAVIAPDRASAELTLHSEPVAPLSLDQSVRIVTWQPAAYVKAHDSDGKEIASTKLDAPLQPGQLVEVGGNTFRVAPTELKAMWPGRDSETGICKGDIDWQHVTLIPEPQEPHEPKAKREPGSRN